MTELTEEDALLEQYRTVRQESLEALSRHQTIAQYGTALAGVAVGAGLLAGKSSAPAAAIVLMGLVPLAAIFGAAMMATEAQRIARAGCFLRYVESRLNEVMGPMGGKDSRAFTWESDLSEEVRVRGYALATAVVLLSAVTMGPGLGGYFLLHAGLTAEFIVAATVDLIAVVVLAVWARSTMADIRRWTIQSWQ